MSVLSPERRKELEQACVRGRRTAEAASRAAIGALGLLDERPPPHLSEGERNLRRALRAKRDQLGDQRGQIDLLVIECAYEQWHRLLFARFLAENNLLIHPQFGVQVTLAECDELAADLGEPDAWAVAGRFAADILPGIFRLDDPCVQLRLAPEGRLALEQIVETMSADTFAADDALGWVYQHWQKERKAEVNASERKIGGSDLAPVTQLFTENYMVRFLLENSLGAWWASRRANSPLLAGWEYLRYDEDGKPATGTLQGWPAAIAEVTVLDPCCGSGHFLVEAFGMLWRMRAEDEGLAPVAAQDAVLRDNLFGLELDPRCVQIAMFALAMAAWKAGGGWRELPVPNVACSGTVAKAPTTEWTSLAAGDARLADALLRLHKQFRDADTLGSLVDPRTASESIDPAARQRSIDDVEWGEVAPLFDAAAQREAADPAAVVFGVQASAMLRAAAVLTRRHTLVVTNPPFLAVGRMEPRLRDFVSTRYAKAKHDLATTMLSKYVESKNAHSTAMVLPENWLATTRYESMRRLLLSERSVPLLGWLGANAFETDAIGSRVRVVLIVISRRYADDERMIAMADAAATSSPAEAALALRQTPITRRRQASQLNNPDARIINADVDASTMLSSVAESRYGLRTGDSARLVRKFWELATITGGWRFHQSTVARTVPYGGREDVLDWGDGAGALHELARVGIAALQGQEAWGRLGVAVSLTGEIRSTLYSGTSFDNNCAVIWPKDPELLPALWAFCSSPVFHSSVRTIDDSLKVMNATLLKVPFDVEHWRSTAQDSGPLPEPFSNDPTQWIFTGHPDGAADPLQVAVARLLGYRWPDQPDDDLGPLADDDGIVCLPSVFGERTAADRLQELLARSFDRTWSPARAAELLAAAGSKKGELDSWLRDEFFKAHCLTFKNRPFVWHIWDGRKDGFSALASYHRLDRATLERLAYTYLGDWIERQAAGVREDVVGAEERLIAARELQRKLKLILAGEPPYDIYVRWKPVGAQAACWAPDLDDGVRLNVRPFVQAGVLRAKFNVKWDKDRGKNPDGSERHNDLHLTNAEKQDARDAGVSA